MSLFFDWLHCGGESAIITTAEITNKLTYIIRGENI